MKKLLIETLESLGYPVCLQGSMNENEAYPPSFITFFTTGGDDIAHFDNMAAGTAWNYQVIFYSSDPALVETEAARIRKTLKAAGFIPQGKGMDIPSDEPTYTGWVNEFFYLEMEG